MPSRLLVRLALLSLIAFPALQAQPFVRSGALNPSGPMFNAPNFGPPPVQLASEGAVFPYDVFSFRVGVTGTYRFDAVSTAGNPTQRFSTALYLYANAFNPSAPLTNLLYGATSYNDPEDPTPPNQLLPFEYGLNLGTTYFLVASSYFENPEIESQGAPLSFNEIITCPQNSCAILPPANVVVPEPGTIVLVATGMIGLLSGRRRRRA